MKIKRFENVYTVKRSLDGCMANGAKVPLTFNKYMCPFKNYYHSFSLMFTEEEGTGCSLHVSCSYSVRSQKWNI